MTGMTAMGRASVAQGRADAVSQFHRHVEHDGQRRARSRADLRNRLGHGGNPRLLGCADERQRVRGQLERFCGRDTMGMLWIVEALRQLLGWTLRGFAPALKRAPADIWL